MSIVAVLCLKCRRRNTSFNCRIIFRMRRGSYFGSVQWAEFAALECIEKTGDLPGSRHLLAPLRAVTRLNFEHPSR